MRGLDLVGRWRRILAIARKELWQLRRDPLTAGFVVGVPIVQLLLFGYAINQDVRNVPTALVDQSRSEISRLFAGQLEGTQTLEFVASVEDEGQARRLLEAGEVQVVVTLPSDLAKEYYRGRGAKISVLVDATDPTLARAVRAAVEGLQEKINEGLQPFFVEGQPITLRVSPDRLAFWAQPELIQVALVEMRVLNLHNPELRTAVFVVPGLLGVILTTTMILMTALAVVREREKGTFEFLIATPVRREELMAGKILPYVGIGLLQIFLVVTTGLLLFRVPMRGSLLALLIASLIFIAANLALGLVISAATRSQLQATQVSFFFFLPSVLLSGFMFPFQAMPKPAQWLGELLPLTHYIRLCKGILLRGAGLGSQGVDLAAMLLFFALGLLVAIRLFRKQLV